MAGTLARSGVVEAEPNVIPMIDVLLVMIVIFMLLFRVRHVIPTQVSAPAPTNSGTVQIVLEVADDGFRLNGQPITDAALEATIGAVYHNRPNRLLFIKASPNRTYQEVVSAMDRVRGAGVAVIAFVPR